MSRSEIVKKAWIKRRETFVPPMKGKQMSAESRLKMSLAKIGKPSHRIGVPHTIETRKLISLRTRERTPRGRDCHSFKDGKLSERRGERFSPEYKRWRYDVFVRDHFTCQKCGDKRGGNLRAHHVKPFATHPELRFDTSNGVTYCDQCHDDEHYG